MLYKIKSFFLFEQRNATFKKEIIGGLSGFLTMCYVLAVNPQILSAGYLHGATDYNGISKDYVMGGLFLITAVVTFAGTLLLGLLTNLPAAASSSLGCNTFFAYTLTTSLGVSPAGGMLAAIISTVLFFILSVTKARKYLFNNIPPILKVAIASAIGLYLAAVGLKFIGLLGQTKSNGVLVGVMSFGYLANPSIYLGLGIFIFAIVFHIFKIPGSLPLAMIGGLILGLILNAVGVYNMPNWNSLVHYKDYLQSMGGISSMVSDKFINFGNSFTQIPFYVGCVMFLLIIFFESSGSTTAFMAEMEKYEPSAIPEDKKTIFTIDSASGVVGSVLGVTPCCVFISTAVGVSQGARTGFSGCFIALMFLLAVPLYPLFFMFFPYDNAIEAVAQRAGMGDNISGIQMAPITGAALLFTGSLMFSGLKNIDYTKTEQLIPTLFLVALMPFTSSIPNGIVFGFIFYVITMCAAKRIKEINLVTWGSTAVLIIYLIIFILLDLKII